MSVEWRRLADRAAEIVGTPCYVMSESCLGDNIRILNSFESSLPLRHWVSMKTQPVARVLSAAMERGLGIEVVSKYELSSALDAGVPASKLLLNGVGKHSWLSRYRIQNVTVHFDSIAEVRALAAQARELHWRVGLRCAISDRVAGAEAEVGSWDQFGMTMKELAAAVEVLKSEGVVVSGLHFHLHTNVSRVSDYRDAIENLAEVSEALQLEPDYIDMGGGLPIAGEIARGGTTAASTFQIDEFRELLARLPLALPSIREVWMENGRFLTGSTGVLVVTVLDRKERGDTTYLICDGGRVNHARVAAWESHEIMLAPARTGPKRKMVVYGPTCTIVDSLGGWMLPDPVELGDRVIWLNAGAYHIPLETRFSTGWAPVVWFNEQQQPEVIRHRETPQQWWNQWVAPAGKQLVAVG